MLPTSEIGLWIDNLGESPSPDAGLYGLACSINQYCGIISPWGTPLLIFGDLPSDIIYVPAQYDGLLVRWVGTDSLERLAASATAEASTDTWDETKQIKIVDKEMTIMDTCTNHDDAPPNTTRDADWDVTTMFALRRKLGRNGNHPSTGIHRVIG